MFFVLSKTLGFVVHPSNTIALICMAGAVLLLTRWRRAGRVLLVAGVVLLLIVGYSPLGNVLMLSLSERFPPWRDTGRAPDGIIVLGGAINSEVSAARGTLELDASAERVFAALDLARRYPQARIVYSGGSGNLIQRSAAEAPIAGELLKRFGVAADRVVLEDESRTTAENAAHTRALVVPKPGELWLLVTSSFHMPRSMIAFRDAGFDVVAYPVDWRTRGPEDRTLPFATLAAGLARTDVAVHEWAGLLAYRLGGKTTSLLPSP
ncbi:YdcF family protein [Rhodopseudomonas palustris]|uniref:YdcF family protein n=1 Tax=Rhodopseudomonas palustris TaxID=1076 RepID=A0A323UJ08_RHOPL|nr:YdcF family protein [Rhodopseudomonas palustris]PZA12291.1 YdcF family protein [Rhodopseudomonas palustris]